PSGLERTTFRVRFQPSRKVRDGTIHIRDQGRSISGKIALDLQACGRGQAMVNIPSSVYRGIRRTEFHIPDTGLRRSRGAVFTVPDSAADPARLRAGSRILRRGKTFGDHGPVYLPWPYDFLVLRSGTTARPQARGSARPRAGAAAGPRHRAAPRGQALRLAARRRRARPGGAHRGRPRPARPERRRTG